MTEASGGRAKLVIDNATKFYETRSGPLHALDGYALPTDTAATDVDAIHKRFFANAAR